MRRAIPGIFGGTNKGSLILLFSPRERVRDILSVGLVQCNYQVLQADTSYQAAIKANQMLPKAVLIDVSAENSKDILLAERLRKSMRSRNISILLITPKQPDALLIRVISELALKSKEEDSGRIQMINFPFAFSEFLEKVKLLVTDDKSEQMDAKKGGGEQNNAIAERLFDNSIEPVKKMAEVSSVLQNQWAFPFTIIKAMDIIESDAGCCVELAKCISTDPAVSSAVLKISNTVQYARRHGRINDIRDAVVRLGFRETRSVMACLSLINLTPEIYKSRGFERREFWLHSLAVGLIAEKLCADIGFRRPELAFIAGLLHDLGKIPLDNNFDWVFPKLLDQTMVSYTPFFETEERSMKFTHAEFGHYLTTLWNFPSLISCAILHHHNREQILKTTTLYDKLVQEAVYVANQLAKAVSIGHSCDEILEEIPFEIMRDLKLTNGPSDWFFKSVDEKLQLLCSYLNLDTGCLTVHTSRPFTTDSDVVIVYNEKALFHPMVTALRNNGFLVKVTSRDIPEPPKGKRVIISIPEKGFPLDIIFYGDNQKNEIVADVLKIFIVDTEQPRHDSSTLASDNILFMDRNTFDIRLLLHTLDTFFERIITPPPEDPAVAPSVKTCID
ncbi:MAG: HDOD domain-containing protein [Chitinispirillaceae bacterium]|nr:HDOD domain-containing protein [Chitinispirillaceae bacterium]